VNEHKLESSVLSGDGNIFSSAELASELFKNADNAVIDAATFAIKAKAAISQLKQGDNGPLVDKLAAELQLLDILFTRTARLAVQQSTSERMTVLLDMALKIQNNARRTASAIKDLTHPKAPTSFIRADTANVATNQQINKYENILENELYGDNCYEMDRRSAKTPKRACERVETVAKVDRSDNS